MKTSVARIDHKAQAAGSKHFGKYFQVATNPNRKVFLEVAPDQKPFSELRRKCLGGGKQFSGF